MCFRKPSKHDGEERGFGGPIAALRPNLMLLAKREGAPTIQALRMIKFLRAVEFDM